MKQHLSHLINVTSNQAKIEVVPLEGSVLQIYLFTDESTLYPFTLKYLNEIEITPEDRQKLTKQCADENVTLTYEL